MDGPSALFAAETIKDMEKQGKERREIYETLKEKIRGKESGCKGVIRRRENDQGCFL